MSGGVQENHMCNQNKLKETEIEAMDRKLEIPKNMTSDYKVVHLPSEWSFVCCDCGLAHRYEMSLDSTEKHLVIKVLRDNELTAHCRRHEKQLFVRRKKKKTNTK